MSGCPPPAATVPRSADGVRSATDRAPRRAATGVVAEGRIGAWVEGVHGAASGTLRILTATIIPSMNQPNLTILVLYYSRLGATRKLAKLIAQGVESVPGCDARL